MTDLLDKQVGPVAISASFSGGKLVFSASDAAVGASSVTSVDASVIIAALEAALDAKYPSAKSIVDLVSGIVKEAILAL